MGRGMDEGIWMGIWMRGVWMRRGMDEGGGYG